MRTLLLLVLVWFVSFITAVGVYHGLVAVGSSETAALIADFLTALVLSVIGTSFVLSRRGAH